MSPADQLDGTHSSPKTVPAPNDVPTEFDSEIELLFSEVNVLSKELRQGHRLPGTTEDLLPAEMNLLQVLARNGARTVPQVARTRGTSRQNIQIMVNRLEKAGCVESVSNPAHRRSPLLVITTGGRDRLLKASSREQAIFKSLSKHISLSEVREALQVLRKLRAVITHQTAPADLMRLLSHPKTKPPPKLKSLNIDEEVEENELPVNLL